VPKRFGAFLLGAALISALIPKKSMRSPAPAPPPRPVRKLAQKPLYALVQTQPHALVLAISDSRADLEAEMGELNETWNLQDLRTEPHSYEVQPVCLLQTDRDPFPKLTEA
jgi:hypothetical protein